MTPAYSLEEQYYPVNGIRLHVVESGPADGPVLLFLHGFPEFWYGWRKQIPYFAALGYRVVAPDGRGYNLSSKPAGIGSYKISEVKQDIVELIKQLGVEKVYLAGHDWGAIVAWNLAIFYPQYLRKLIILNVPHPVVARQTFRKRPDQWRRSWYVFFIQLPWLPEKLVSRGGFKLLKWMLRRTSLPGTFSAEDLQHYQQAWSQPGSFTAMLNWYRGLRYGNQPNARMAKGLIEVPALVIWGAKDAFLRAEMAAKSVKKCRNGRLLLLPEATHWIQHEKPDIVNQAIEQFLRKDSTTE